MKFSDDERALFTQLKEDLFRINDSESYETKLDFFNKSFLTLSPDQIEKFYFFWEESGSTRFLVTMRVLPSLGIANPLIL